MVISSIRDEKSWREILGMERSAYLVGAILKVGDIVDWSEERSSDVKV